MKLRSSVLVISALGVALSGCGGSGSQGNETPPSGNIYTGVVIDGPLQGATVFADINRNGVKDPGEPATVTDSNGKYTLRISTDIYHPPVIVDVQPTAVDADTGQAVGKYYRLEAPDGVYSVINPITTMIKALMDVNPGLKQRDAERMVRGYLGLSDSYEIYADYTLKTPPSSVSEEKWKGFLSESGRAHNIARIAAAVMGSYWENAKAAYGGSVPSEKITLVNSLLTEATLKRVAPLASGLPNNVAIDLNDLTISDVSVNYVQMEAKIRNIALGANVSLAQIVRQDELHVLPFKTAAANYAHFVLKDGGSSNSAGQVISGDSNVLLPNTTETYEHSLQTPANQRKALFQGAVSFDPSTGEDTLGDSQTAFRWRVTRLSVAGDLQRNLYDLEWLKDPLAVWPAGSIVYKAIVKTSGTGMIAYEEDTSKLYSGSLAETLYNGCCGTVTPNNGLRVGNMIFRFAPPGVSYGLEVIGETSLASISGSAETALATKGSWTLKQTYVGNKYLVLGVPADYWSYLGSSVNDGLFSPFSKPSMVIVQVGEAKYMVGWQYPEGRYAEFYMLNTVAYDALKNNLKW